MDLQTWSVRELLLHSEHRISVPGSALPRSVELVFCLDPVLYGIRHGFSISAISLESYGSESDLDIISMLVTLDGLSQHFHERC